MPAPGRFIAWCKQEQASLEQQLEMMESGKVRTGEDIGSGWIDTTEQSIERAKARLAELNELLTEEGTASVVKPSSDRRRLKCLRRHLAISTPFESANLLLDSRGHSRFVNDCVTTNVQPAMP
jgi:hypothetical protein